MGSAESSTLESVESLSVSLLEIERKLASIEDVHLHHERTICHDDIVVVSGKRIQCRSSVTLIVGPLLGTISSSSVRVMIETDIDTSITLNIFHADEIIPDGRFLLSETHEIVGYTATAWTVTGLMPNTRYLLYVGGLKPNDTLFNYATFSTIPLEPEKFRLFFTCHGRIDSMVPGEVNLWNRMSRLVEASKLSNSTSKESRADASPVHLVMHLGDFVSVEDIVRNYGIQLLDMLSRDEIDESSWLNLLKDMEAALLQLYRKALSNATVKNLFRNCGHLFLSGFGETAINSASIFGIEDAGSGVTGEIEKLQEEEKQQEVEEQRQRDEKRIMKKYGIKTMPLAKKKDDQVEINQDPDGSNDSDDIPEDKEKRNDGGGNKEKTEVTGIAQLHRRNHRLMARRLMSRKEVESELRRMVLGCLLRLGRRVYWRYLRQLWDEDYIELNRLDLQDEDMHRELIRLKRAVWMKKDVQRRLRQTLKKFEDTYGREYNACVQIRDSLRATTEDVLDVEEALNGFVTQVSSATKTLKDFPSGAVLSIGGIGILMIELHWGWLTADGVVHESTRTEVTLHPLLWNRLETLLGMQRGEGDGATTSGGVRAIGDSETPMFQREVESTLHSLIIATPSPLLPTGGPKFIQRVGGFTLCGPDLRDLLGTAARWQTGDLKRAVLLAGGGVGFAGSGWASPPQVSLWKQIQADDVKDVWEDRSSLCQLAVGALTLPPGPPIASLPSIPALIKSAAITASGAATASGFGSLYNVESRGGVGSRTFWDVSPQLPSGIPGEGATFGLILLNDRDPDTIDSMADGPVRLSIGPIVGLLTPTTALLILETLATGFIRMVVVDQITGVEYSLSRLVNAQVPTTFLFDSLLPHRPYIYYIDNDSNHVAMEGDAEKVRTNGTFTTPADYRMKGESGAGSLRAIRDARSAANALDKESDFSVSASDSLSHWSASVETTEPKDVIRILILGAYSPIVPHSTTASITASGPSVTSTAAGSQAMPAFTSFGNNWAQERDRILQGCELIREITALVRSPWSPIDLTLHVGGVVDLSYSAVAAAGLLAQAESSNFGDDEVLNRQISDAEQFFRGAYRLHWGAKGTMRDLLMHGSHLMSSCPVADLCSGMGNASYIQHLKRDYSEFSINHLLRMTQSADDIYQGTLWGEGLRPSKINSISHTRHSPTSVGIEDGNHLRTNFLVDGAVGIVSLCLQPPHYQTTSGDNSGDIIGQQQLLELNDILFGDSARLSNLSLLIIVSPIPLLTEDPRKIYHSFLPSDQSPIQFSESELVRLFDMFYKWIYNIDDEAYSEDEDEVDENQKIGIPSRQKNHTGKKQREVVIVCGGVPVSFTTTIKGFGMQVTDREALLKRNAVTEKSVREPFFDFQPDVVFRQICIGVITGPPLNTPAIALAAGELVSPPCRDFKGARYRFFHDINKPKFAQCTVLEVRGAAATKILQKEVSKQKNKVEKLSVDVLFLNLDDIYALSNGDDGVTGQSWVSPIPEEVAFVWKGVESIMSGASGGDQDAVTLSRAIKAAMSGAAARTVLPKCHMLLKEGAFGFLVSTGSSSQPILSSLLLWAKKEMELAGLRLSLVDPSPHVVKQIWSSVCGRIWSGLTNILTQDNVEVDGDEMVLAEIHGDSNLFGQFVYETFEAAALLQHCAYTRGLKDGW